MARTILVWAPTGLATPTCKIMLQSAPLTLVETITLAEHATIKRAYTGTVTASAGQYRYNLLSVGTFIGGGSIYIGSTDATTYQENNSLDWQSIVNQSATVALSNTSIASAGGTGTGARTVTPTVQTSGAVAIQGAHIRFTKGAESYLGTTNSSGQVSSFNLDDGTWTVSITAPGYTFSGTTIVVDGTENPVYTMTTNSVSAPSAPNLSVGTLLCLGTDGLPEANAEVTFRMTRGPGDAGYSLDAAEFTAVADADGEVEQEFVQNAQYAARRGTVGREVLFIAPIAASFSLPEHLGAP